MHFYQFDEWEFYDLEKDPDELHNEYNNADYADVIAEVKQQFTDLQKHYDDNSVTAVLSKEEQAEHRPEPTQARVQ